MLAIPSALQSKFDEQLQIRATPSAWLGSGQASRLIVLD